MSVYKAIAAVMSDLSKIGIAKNKTNSQQNFKYRGVDDVMNELAALLPKHGLVILPRVLKRDMVERVSGQGKALFYVWLDVEFDFVSVVDGSKHVVGPIVGEAMDSGDKGSNKALSIAYKYACFLAFCIPTEAVTDPDEESHAVLTPAQSIGKRLVEAYAIGVDDAVYEVWDEARKNEADYRAAWKLLTADERKNISAAIERSKIARQAA